MDNRGYTAVMSAAVSGNKEVLELLLKNVSNLKDIGTLPLHLSARYFSSTSVLLFLYLIFRFGHESILQLILDKMNSPALKDQEAETHEGHKVSENLRNRLRRIANRKANDTRSPTRMRQDKQVKITIV